MDESEDEMKPLAQLAKRAGILQNTALMAGKRQRFYIEKRGRDWYARPSEFQAWASDPKNHKAGRRPSK